MQSFLDAIRTIFGVFLDALTFIRLCFKPGLASRPRTCFCANSSAYISSAKSNHDELPMPFAFTLAQLSGLFDWRNALTIVKPDTLIRWHRIGFRLFWKNKSRPRGRPRVPAEVRKLIIEMAT